MTASNRTFVLGALVLAIAGLVAWLVLHDAGVPVRPDANERGTIAHASSTSTDVEPATQVEIPEDERSGGAEDQTPRVLGSIELAGRVTDAQGNAIRRPRPRDVVDPADAGALVKAPVKIVARLGTNARSGKVDAEGRYSITGLCAGSWRVTASAIGHASQELVVEIDGRSERVVRDFALASGEELLVRVVARNAAAEGKAFDGLQAPALADRIASEARVVASRTPPDATKRPWFADPSAVTREVELTRPKAKGDDWTYELRLPAQGEPATHVSLAIAGVIVATRDAAPSGEATELEFDARGYAQHFASVAVQVIDAATRAPIEGARVQLLRTTKPADDGEASGALDQGTTDATGTLELRCVDAGTVQLVATAAEHEKRALAIELRAGSATKLPPIELGTSIAIRGRVVGADGKTIAARVECVPEDGGATIGGRTRLDGTFEVLGLARARYVLRLAQPTNLWATPTAVDTTRGSVANVELVATAATPVTLELVADHALGDDVAVYVTDESGKRATSDLRTSATAPSVHLPPGRWRAIVHRGAETIVEQTFEVASSAVTISLRVP